MKRIALPLMLLATPAFAASAEKDTPNGRYAMDAAACKAKEYFVTITDESTTLPTFGCKGVDYDQTENGNGRVIWTATAASCVGETNTKPHKESFRLLIEAGTLRILWSNGTKSAVFTRCAP